MTRLFNPMRARSADEPHRVSTPLELFFDLCFVVAVGLAVTPLHHAVAEHHAVRGLHGFLVVFFAIWWAWMNFTWFAGAYDTDDVVYRVTTLVQIAGALVLAAGIAPAFEDGDFRINTIGYVVMRTAMVFQWLRAARSDRPRRRVAARYAAGVVTVQLLWLLRLTVDSGSPLFLWSVLALIVLELAVPVWAELAPGGPTTFHPHHIAERYGLFTIIVLGESLTSATVAFADGLDLRGEDLTALIRIAIGGLVIVFALWWIYFDRPGHDRLTSLRASLLWGYGHYFVFAAAAAVGAGLGVAVDRATGHAELSGQRVGFALAVPVSVYLVAVWALHRTSPAMPVAAALAVLTPLTPAPVESLAVVLVAATAVVSLRRSPAGRKTAKV